jgi:hypothetical protein
MRQRLPDRRASITEYVEAQLDGGKTKRILVTVGFDDAGQPREVFCADFKAGTAMHAVIMDACILLSRLLQHGDLPQDLYKALCDKPPSVIGAIACLVARL